MSVLWWKSMVLADANTMIRCIIGDDMQKVQELEKIRKTQEIMYTLEVIAEVVYVLTKVYNVSRKETANAIVRFLNSKNIICVNSDIAFCALGLFADNKLDFVDNILLAYNKIQGITIYSYDNKLMNMIERKDF